ncbi:MAG TPA: metallophosphoesterase [Anaerolineales bacterium]
MTVGTLTLSDVLLRFIYSPQIRTRFSEVELVLGCGDLPYYYLEYIISSLDVPLYFVRGNHASIVEHTVAGPRSGPLGAVDLHRQVINHDGLLLCGVEGSLRYREGPFQYSQSQMWFHVLSLVPRLLLNRAIYGRYLDVFVSHAPPWGIHDKPDLPHQGIKAFRWLLKVFQPSYHFHGHIHVYHPDEVTETKFNETRVINTYGYIEINLEPAASGFAPLGFLSSSLSTD